MMKARHESKPRTSRTIDEVDLPQLELRGEAEAAKRRGLPSCKNAKLALPSGIERSLHRERDGIVCIAVNRCCS